MRPYVRKKSLKAAAFILIELAMPMGSAAFAGSTADLVVGSVRDQDGLPIPNAAIRALDAAGKVAGSDRSDELGTFAVSLAGAATRVEVRCSHCRTASFALAGTANLAIVVTRYRALESDVPSPQDLAALPYGSPADALALVPYVLRANDGKALSDRGLGGGRALVSDDGAPLADLATGTLALVDFPDRYAREISVVRAARAYRYGSYAGAGLFMVDQLSRDGSLWADGGRASSLSLEPRTGDLHPAAGVSGDDGTLSRRGDVDLTTAFAGGALRAGATSATERVALGTNALARNLESVRLAYATASQRYRTSGDFSASDLGVAGDGKLTNDYRSSYLTASVRIERPGPIDLAAGLRATRQTTSYAGRSPQSSALAGRTADQTFYVEADRTTNATSAHAALALANVVAAETLSAGNARGAHLALLPAIGVETKVGGGAYVRAGYSQSQRLPTLLEIDGAALPPSSLTLELAELSESAIGYDTGGRLRVEAIAYREFTHGFNERRLDGIGASLVWQLAPLLTVRAWSLRATPHEFASAYAGGDATRHVLWTTYANGEGLRLDAIVHRDVSGTRHPAIGLDGDAYLPLAARVAVDVGSSRRGDVRRYYLGVRLR